MYRVDHNHQPTDVIVTRVGNCLVGQDVFPGGDLSCLKQHLGEYKSPEHADIMRELLFSPDPRMLVLIASGKITDEMIDQMVERLRVIRAAGKPSTSPEGTTPSE